MPREENPKIFDAQVFANYRFFEELSIVSYYTRFKKDGLIAASDLLMSRQTPLWVKEQASKTLLFYVHNIEGARFEPIVVDLPRIREDSKELYHPMNPSIIRRDDGYELICRAVNYTQTGAKHFHTTDIDGVFRTKNFLLSYTKNFDFRSQVEISGHISSGNESQKSFVQGMEDCRLFMWGNSRFFTCTQRDMHPDWIPQIVLYELGDVDWKQEALVANYVPLLGPDLNRCEKNWLPFVKKDVFRLIYSYDPFLIYEPDLDTGECKTWLKWEPECDCSRFRGSAGPIDFDGGILVLLHEVSYKEDGSRVYLHRFLSLNADFSFRKISIPFTFKHQGVEFCCSMVLDHAGKELILPIGIEDNEAFICRIDVETVRNLFN